MAGVSKSQVSRLCEEIDERVRTFLERPIEGDWPYLWIDATCQNCSQGAHVAERYRQETKEKDRLVTAAKFREDSGCSARA